MIQSLETERMSARPVRLEDSEQVQRVFPQWEIVKHVGPCLGEVIPSPRRWDRSRFGSVP